MNNFKKWFYVLACGALVISIGTSVANIYSNHKKDKEDKEEDTAQIVSVINE